MKKTHSLQWILVLWLVLMSVMLLACGRRQEAPAETKTPARPPTVTPLPTVVFEQPTTIITVAATATPVPAETVDLERGRRLYESKGCAGCHGAQGEGVASKAKGLAGTQLTEQEFTDILRTGGAGKLGNEHLYGMQAISPSGMKALYAYIKSFPAR